ncbi:transposase [Pedobacter sp.]|nr:transposase [Candidatus Saccharibacteria bacterium]
MPSRNVIKIDVPHSYYHVYARGRGRQAIFRDDEDYRVFLNLFKRHLSIETVTDNYGKPYPHLRGSVELLCYCLMTNHFHLLIYQKDLGAMQRMMRGIMTSYSRYFNAKYDSSGSLFESRYKASRISTDAYLMHISRYIHLNPKDWLAHPYSSVHAYFGIGQPEWLQPERITELFASLPVYADFLYDYEDYKQSLEEIKYELAN